MTQRAPQDSGDTDEDITSVLGALADPARLHLLATVASSPGSEACVCDLESVGVDGPTLTAQLSELVSAGLLRPDSRRDGWVWFRLVPARLAAVVATLDGLLPEDRDARLAS